VLTSGTGATVAKGDTLIANYVGQKWAPKGGKSNVFDSSFARGAPAAFVIGAGQVIPGWDKTLVGKKLGSRLLLTVPPADGYGPSGQSKAGTSGTDTLVFVVDLTNTYRPNASAPGTVVHDIPSSGLPKITNVPGKKPAITSTAGVKVPTKPTSTLLVRGSGPKINTAKTLVLQLVQTDIATGKHTQNLGSGAPDRRRPKRVERRRQAHRPEHRQPSSRPAPRHRRGTVQLHPGRATSRTARNPNRRRRRPVLTAVSSASLRGAVRDRIGVAVASRTLPRSTPQSQAAKRTPCHWLRGPDRRSASGWSPS
jgi:FKBP-type peptidyl-prolyl cis-trans isomerase